MNWKEYFPTVSSRSFLSYYLPASGAISHTLFAVHIFNPSIVSSRDSIEPSYLAETSICYGSF
uniref:Uncharacterized protein n=1 Tax=Heterorhabditis bacteriophora TaxID=37862 RepID=A0A1I7XAE1_HETBA